MNILYTTHEGIVQSSWTCECSETKASVQLIKPDILRAIASPIPPRNSCTTNNNKHHRIFAPCNYTPPLHVTQTLTSGFWNLSHIDVRTAILSSGGRPRALRYTHSTSDQHRFATVSCWSVRLRTRSVYGLSDVPAGRHHTGGVYDTNP